MPQRSEPQILADLIRLDSRLARESEVLGIDNAADRELIEQARAALHRNVVANAQGKLRAPINVWSGFNFALGAVSTGVSLLAGWPLWLCLTAATLIAAGASMIIDHKQL